MEMQYRFQVRGISDKYMYLSLEFTLSDQTTIPSFSFSKKKIINKKKSSDMPN